MASFYRFLQDTGYATVNPARGLPLPKVAQCFPTCLTAEQARALLDAAHTPWHRAMIALLLELCRQAGGYTVADSTMSAEPPLDWEQILGETERTIVCLLLAHGPILDRTIPEELCIADGMNAHTFSVYLSGSPVLARLTEATYSLRGADVPPGALEARSSGIARAKVLLDYGWLTGQKIWLGYKVSRAMLQQGYLTIPSAMRRHLQGEFELRTADGARLGALDTDAGQPTGLRGFFRRRGGEPGDQLAIVFDLGARSATITIGESGLFDDLRRAACTGTGPDGAAL